MRRAFVIIFHLDLAFLSRLDRFSWPFDLGAVAEDFHVVDQYGRVSLVLVLERAFLDPVFVRYLAEVVHCPLKRQ